jgi:hypothetical protein
MFENVRTLRVIMGLDGWLVLVGFQQFTQYVSNLQHLQSNT